jgi:hypothetical protein
MRTAALLLVTASLLTTAQAQVIAPRSGAPQILIPAAGAVIGAGGEVFRSDISIFNYRSRDQVVQFRWLPQGVTGIGLSPVQITMRALTGLSSEDFVTTVLQQSGLGALLIKGVTRDGVQDSGANIVATARIWSNQPGSSGTVSQTFPVLSTAELTVSSPYALGIQGLRRDSRYRLNVGVVNLDMSTHAFRIVIGTLTNTQETMDVSVPPLSMRQVNMPGATSNPLQIFVTNLENSTNQSTGDWTAYGSNVDNVTGDSWSAIGFVVKVFP